MSKTAPQPGFEPQTFRDGGWKIRTMVMPDGTALQVDDYLVTAQTPGQLAFLQGQPDLTLQAAAAADEV